MIRLGIYLIQAILFAIAIGGWAAFAWLYRDGGLLAEAPMLSVFCWIAALGSLTFAAVRAAIPDRRES